MSNGHTPGPWATYRDQLSVGETHGHSGICEVWERHGGQGFENARLIAAAPDLLAVAECEEALDMPHKQAVEVLERYGWSHADRFELPAKEFVVRLRRAAIAKANGQPC